MRASPSCVLPFLFAAGLAGCCPRPWPKVLTPLPDAPTVVREVASRRGALRSVSATAKVDAFTREGRVRAREVLVAERGGRLRFETLSPFEQPLSTLVSDGKGFALYDLGKKRYYHGPATPANIGRLLPIRMRGEEVAQILLGEAPVIVHDSVELALERCRTRYRLTLRRSAPPVRQVLAIDAERLVPLESHVYLDGDLVYSLAFDRHEDIEKVPLPRRIRYRAPRDQVDVLLLYGDVAANEKLEDDLFRLEVPRGVEVVKVE